CGDLSAHANGTPNHNACMCPHWCCTLGIGIYHSFPFITFVLSFYLPSPTLCISACLGCICRIFGRISCSKNYRLQTKGCCHLQCCQKRFEGHIPERHCRCCSYSIVSEWNLCW